MEENLNEVIVDTGDGNEIIDDNRDDNEVNEVKIMLQSLTEQQAIIADQIKALKPAEAPTQVKADIAAYLTNFR